MAQPGQSIDISISKLLKGNGNGWKLSLFENQNKVEAYLCTSCDNVCCDAAELHCSIDHDEINVYCKECLTSEISKNGGKCPIDSHTDPVVGANKFVRTRISKSIVYCPFSFNLNKQNDAQIGHNVVDTIGGFGVDEKEGMMAAAPAIPSSQSGCKWKGKLIDLLKNHLVECVEKNDPSLLLRQKVSILKLTNKKLEIENNRLKVELQKVCILEFTNKELQIQNNRLKVELQNVCTLELTNKELQIETYQLKVKNKELNDKNSQLQYKITELIKKSQIGVFGANDALNEAKNEFNALNTKYRQLLTQQQTNNNVNNNTYNNNNDPFADLFGAVQPPKPQLVSDKVAVTQTENDNNDEPFADMLAYQPLQAQNIGDDDNKNEHVYDKTYKENRVIWIPDQNNHCMFAGDTLHFSALGGTCYFAIGGLLKHEKRVTIHLVTSPVGSRDNYAFGFASEACTEWNRSVPDHSIRKRGDGYMYAKDEFEKINANETYDSLMKKKTQNKIVIFVDMKNRKGKIYNNEDKNKSWCVNLPKKGGIYVIVGLGGNEPKWITVTDFDVRTVI